MMTRASRRKVVSREYKVMLDHRAFADPVAALPQFWQELRDFTCSGEVHLEGEFDHANPKERQVVFFDTIGFTLLENGLVLRRRGKSGGRKAEYTLKCRSEDRYLASGADLSAAKRMRAKEKLEEDIGAPFVSRFSHSTTVRLSDADFGKAPGTIAEAASLFPALRHVRRDGLVCSPKTVLAPVNNLAATERVYVGPEIRFRDPEGPDRATKASVALILWSTGPKGRPLAAEFSFRYRSKKEQYPPTVARIAKTFFSRLQQLDWVRPEAMTKTQYVYRVARQ